MNCPRCEAELTITHRQGVEIDLCPKCRGVWLDRGELDKITARASSYLHDDDDDRDHHDRHRYRDQSPPRRRSFWQELFD